MSTQENIEKQVCRRYIISGRVQGVGFRAYTRQKAIEIGIHGWVRNRDNGDVECLAISDSDKIEIFEKILHHGPPLSKVIDIKISENPVSAIEGFSIVSNSL